MKKIGVISDTHGKLRTMVIEKLQGCDVILHGGDIHQPEIIEKLRAIAPTCVVRGNADKEWAKDIPDCLDEKICGLDIFMVHNKKDVPKNLGLRDLIICGHSHKYEDKKVDGQRFLNPGSCGPRRFNRPVTMALVETDGTKIQISKIEICDEKEAVTDGKDVLERSDKATLIRMIMKEIDRGWSAKKIAQKHGIKEETAVQICRMYLTHPGVDVDGILNRMENK